MNWLSLSKKIALDLLFPIKCLECKLEGDWICKKCEQILRINTIFNCPICNVENSNGRVCGYCVGNSYLDGLLVVLGDSALPREMINYIKYNYILDLLPYFQPKISEYLSKITSWRGFFVLVPIPLHRKKYLRRGFSQSLLIAKLISNAGDNKINNLLLKRIKYSRPQVGLGGTARVENVFNNFKVNNSDLDYNSPIVLVDDIYTTGSTMNECAKVLKKEGFNKVWGIVLVRG